MANPKFRSMRDGPQFGRKIYFNGPDDFTKDGGKAARSMLLGRFILVMGDYHMRNVYKDLVRLFGSNGRKLEKTETVILGGRNCFEDDELRFFATIGWQKPYHVVEYRCLVDRSSGTIFKFLYGNGVPNPYKPVFVRRIAEDGRMPDIIIAGSAVLDLLTHGPDQGKAEFEYRRDLQILHTYFTNQLASTGAKLIWCTTPALPLTTEVQISLEWTKEWTNFTRKSLNVKLHLLNNVACNLFLSHQVPIIDVYHLALKNPMKDLVASFNSMNDGDGTGACLGPDALRYVTHCVLTLITELQEAIYSVSNQEGSEDECIVPLPALEDGDHGPEVQLVQEVDSEESTAVRRGRSSSSNPRSRRGRRPPCPALLSPGIYQPLDGSGLRCQTSDAMGDVEFDEFDEEGYPPGCWMERYIAELELFGDDKDRDGSPDFFIEEAKAHVAKVELQMPTLELPMPTLELPMPTLELPMPTLEFPMPTSELPMPTSELPMPTSELPMPMLELPMPTLELQMPTLEELQVPTLEQWVGNLDGTEPMQIDTEPQMPTLEELVRISENPEPMELDDEDESPTA